jgi:hypothetical protein
MSVIINTALARKEIGLDEKLIFVFNSNKQNNKQK